MQRHLPAVVETLAGAFADAGLDPRLTQNQIGHAVLTALAALREAAPR